LNQRFPSIQKYLKEHGGYDLRYDMIPIIPAAHYTCGGVVTDLWGRTNIVGLYSAGEAACTGLHGGNRLASTSLLEGLVFGASIADYVGGTCGSGSIRDESEEDIELARQIISSSSNSSSSYEENKPNNNNTNSNNNATTKYLLSKLRKTMWDNVGLIRKPKNLKNAMNILNNIREEADDLLLNCSEEESIIGLRDAVYASEAVTAAAYKNRKSVGAHYIIDDEEEEGGDGGSSKEDGNEDRVAMY